MAAVVAYVDLLRIRTAADAEFLAAAEAVVAELKQDEQKSPSVPKD